MNTPVISQLLPAKRSPVQTVCCEMWEEAVESSKFKPAPGLFFMPPFWLAAVCVYSTSVSA